MLSRMRTSLSQIGINANTRNLIIPISFALPILMLYVLSPVSFEAAWKGRTPLLLFLWLLLLELVLGWKKLLNARISWTRFRIAAVIVAAAAPTIYVISAFFLGMDHNVMELGKVLGVPYQAYPELALLEWHWPLSFEYFLFTVFFIAFVCSMYEINGIKRFSISLFFLGATCFFYMIDTFYPFGTIAVLQAFAPVTTSCTVCVLNWMGYEASWYYSNPRYTYGVRLPVLEITGLPPPQLAIGWPCAGVHSLFIYTFVILLFLKDAAFSLERKIIYVAIGAIGTFIVNVLRIVTICIIAVNVGREAMNMFHNYYGELFFVAWIIIYPLTIIYGHKIWAKLSMLGVKLIETGRRFLKVTEH